jgi:hypothetical protein
VEKYLDREAAAIETRQRKWRDRTQPSDEAVATRERQRVHRLREKVRPRTIMESVDPWQVGLSALQRLARPRSSVRSNSRALGLLEEIAEDIRALAWVPTDARSLGPPLTPAPCGLPAQCTPQNRPFYRNRRSRNLPLGSSGPDPVEAGAGGCPWGKLMFDLSCPET